MRSAFLALALLAGAASAATPATPPAASAPAGAAQRSLAELTTPDEPAWPLVQGWIAAAPDVQVLPADPAAADAVLLQAQVTLRSPLGAVIHHTGGLLIDHGWLRVLGSGSPRLARTLASWNAGRAPVDADGRPLFVLVADDVLGGQFAINGGGLGPDQGQLYYLAPDTLRWEPLSIGYTQFLAWALSPGIAKFYETQRWPHWQDEVGRLTGDQALDVTPHLWGEGPPVAQRARRVVPLAQLVRTIADARAQLARQAP